MTSDSSLILSLSSIRSTCFARDLNLLALPDFATACITVSYNPLSAVFTFLLNRSLAAIAVTEQKSKSNCQYFVIIMIEVMPTVSFCLYLTAHYCSQRLDTFCLMLLSTAMWQGNSNLMTYYSTTATPTMKSILALTNFLLLMVLHHTHGYHSNTDFPRFKCWGLYEPVPINSQQTKERTNDVIFLRSGMNQLNISCALVAENGE